MGIPHAPFIFKKGFLMADRKRQNELKIYLSDEEQSILNYKLQLSHMRNKSSFIRHLILYGCIYDINYGYLREYHAALSHINNNLNQIAKRVNSTGNIYKTDIQELKELMNQVWQSQKSMLSKQPFIEQ